MIAIATVLVLAWIALLVVVALVGAPSNGMGSRVERALASDEVVVDAKPREQGLAQAA